MSWPRIPTSFTFPDAKTIPVSRVDGIILAKVERQLRDSRVAQLRARFPNPTHEDFLWRESVRELSLDEVVAHCRTLSGATLMCTEAIIDSNPEMSLDEIAARLRDVRVLSRLITTLEADGKPPADPTQPPALKSNEATTATAGTDGQAQASEKSS